MDGGARDHPAPCGWRSPSSSAGSRIIPHLKEFLARYPEVSIDLVMNDASSDLVEEGIDLAIRSGDMTDLLLIGKKIGTTRRVLVAAPSYLRGKARPTHPRDLAAHDCIAFTPATSAVNWRFQGPEGPLSIEVRGPVRTHNSEGIREAVLSGLGIGHVPIWHFTDEIREWPARAAAGGLRAAAGADPGALSVAALRAAEDPRHDRLSRTAVCPGSRPQPEAGAAGVGT